MSATTRPSGHPGARLAARWRRAAAGGADGGFALATVVGTMMVLSLFVLAATSYAVQSVPSSRRAQDYAAAMAAAQAGVDDVLSRLNQCDAYWSVPCPGSPAEPGRWDGNPGGTETNRWAAVPGGDPLLPARYRYTLVSTPVTTPGLIRVRADGEVNGVRRTVTADLRKRSFLDLIYYTDKEATSPAVMQDVHAARTEYRGLSTGREYWYEFTGVSAAEAAKCDRYYYAVPPAAGVRAAPTETRISWSRTSAGGDLQNHGSTVMTRSCDISFVGGDDINGPSYTNDAMLLRAGADGSSPLFRGSAETYWQTTFDPGAVFAQPWRSSSGTVLPSPAGASPTIAARKLDMPPTNSSLETAANAGGCVYTGPTRIQLASNGTMTVTSPLTSPASLRPGCGLGAGAALPANGVVFVRASTASCTGKPTSTFPLRADDVTRYDCRAGDLFLEGTLKGRLTVASAGDVVVTGDVRYSREVYNTSSGEIDRTVTDVLGIVAQGSVKVYHPVSCGTVPPFGLGCATTGWINLPGTPSTIRIDAAILSVDNSFTVQNYQRGPKLGQVVVRGGIYQRFRGAVGTGDGASGTGYLKDYVFDTRLRSLPPPYFLEPTSSAWQVVGLSE